MKTEMKPRRRLALLLICLFLICYVTFGVFLDIHQDDLVFPGHETQGRPGCTIDDLPEGVALEHFDSANGSEITAAFSEGLRADGRPVQHPASHPTVLFFYGNGMCLKGSLIELDYFRRLGANVLVPDYLGYGMSQGNASEASLYATATAAYRYLLTRKDIDPKRIVAAGLSLGGAVAIDLASRKPVAGLVTFGTFTSLYAMAHFRYPLFPTRWLLHSRFLSAQKIGEVKAPVLIVHGMKDGVVPFSMSGELARDADPPATRIPVAEAHHMDIFKVGGASLAGRIEHFLDSLQDVGSAHAHSSR